MYHVLVDGMILSSALYVVGIILFLLQNPVQATITHYQNLSDFISGLVAYRSAAVLTLATVVLIATPITRVFISILTFAANRNLKYVAVTVIVFLILLTSILLGYVGHFTPE
jgi:uncharacterized membrane protein